MISTRNLLRLSFVLYRNNAGLFLGYSAWTLLPLALLFFLQTILEGELSSGPMIALQILSVGLMLWTSIVYALLVKMIIKQETIHTEDISQKAMTLMGPVFVVGLVVGICTVTGLIFLLLPGMVFIVWYGFAETIVMLEEKRGFDAFHASRDLTRGKFFPILWRLAAGNITLILLYLLLVLGFVGGIEWVTTGQLTLLTETPSLFVQLFEGLIDMFYLPLFTIFMTLFYLDLKGSPSIDV